MSVILCHVQENIDATIYQTRERFYIYQSQCVCVPVRVCLLRYINQQKIRWISHWQAQVRPVTDSNRLAIIMDHQRHGVVVAAIRKHKTRASTMQPRAFVYIPCSVLGTDFNSDIELLLCILLNSEQFDLPQDADGTFMSQLYH